MQKQIKKIKKAWIELTLCDMLDEIIYLMRNGRNKDEEMMKVIKKYSAEICNSQNYGKK